MRPARQRFRLGPAARRVATFGTILALAAAIAGVHGGGSSGRPAPAASPPDEERALLAEATANLERQVAKLAAEPGASCPADFAALDTGDTLRIALFWGYDDHDGKVYDRADAGAMAGVLTRECRGRLSACGFSLAARTSSTVSLERTIGGREVEVTLFTTSRGDDAAESTSFLSADPEQERLSRAVRADFHRELVASDVVFYMGHSRLGGDIGFDRQSGVTTAVNAVLRRPLRPVLAALRQRPTRLKILGLFSCDSNGYFRRELEEANPALSLILTTGDVDYGPAEQASLGALEAILSKSCGHAFHAAMISATEPDPAMTWLFRGR